MNEVNPALRSPFTDLTGCLLNHQNHDKCGRMEMNMMDCLEAYGAQRGKIKCKDLIDDYKECYSMRKQLLRMEVFSPVFVSILHNFKLKIDI